MPIAHDELTDPNIHEPIGVSTASAGQYRITLGQGTDASVWIDPPQEYSALAYYVDMSKPIVDNVMRMTFPYDVEILGMKGATGNLLGETGSTSIQIFDGLLGNASSSIMDSMSLTMTDNTITHEDMSADPDRFIAADRYIRINHSSQWPVGTDPLHIVLYLRRNVP